MFKIILPVVSQLLASIPLSQSVRLYHKIAFDSPVLTFARRKVESHRPILFS